MVRAYRSDVLGAQEVEEGGPLGLSDPHASEFIEGEVPVSRAGCQCALVYGS